MTLRRQNCFSRTLAHESPAQAHESPARESRVRFVNQSVSFLIFAITVGVLAGCLLGTQPSVNGSLGKTVAHPLQASLISFGSGTAILLVINITLGIFPPQFPESASGLPWWIWMGGSIGVVMVSTSLFFVPRIGSLPWFAAVMTGQTVIALILDHYGLLGNARSPVSMLRFIGTALLVLGVLVIVCAKRLEQEGTLASESSLTPETEMATSHQKDAPSKDIP